MGQLSIRDLQKISGEAISALPAATAIKSGRRTVGVLLPIKAIDPDELDAILGRAEALGRNRDARTDDEAMRAFGEVDPVDWTDEAVAALQRRED